MPFGNKSAPLTFLRMINNFFVGMLINTVFTYLDDLVIASKHPEPRVTSFKAVFQRLQETGFKVKLSK